jgi:DNA-binding beta-propeller fold protein YncE
MLARRGVFPEAGVVNPSSLYPRRTFLLFVAAAALCTGSDSSFAADSSKTAEHRLLYVAVPGIRNYLEYGGHGVLVFDIDKGHSFVRRIPAKGLAADGKPMNVKGITASAATRRLYVSTLTSLTCFDLLTDKILWEKSYEGGCDRMALSPDGKIMYLPSLEKDHWHVINALTGDIITKVEPKSGAHNTVYGLDGKHAYLAGLKSPLLRVTDTATHTISKEVGPFTSAIRPFTINGRQTLCFVNVNGLLGFEIGDLVSGKMLHRVEVQGFKPGVPKRHGCPSHGVGLTPDEKEVWVCDAANQRMHVFDATVMPPKQVASIAVRDDPGWITFSLDGKLAYPSTGEVIDVATRKIVATLKDETGAAVHSEKLVEIHFAGNVPVRNGDQFGIGRVR